MSVQQLFGYHFGTKRHGILLLMFRDNLLHRLCYLPSCAVAQGYDHRHGGVLLRVLFSLTKFLLHFFRQPFPIADDTEAYVVLHEDLVFQGGQHEAHQCGDFIRRTVPVLRGEGVECEVLHAQPHAFRCDAAHGLHSCLVSVGARFVAFCCPPAVAVHDDGDVPGYSCHVQFFYHILLLVLVMTGPALCHEAVGERQLER